MYMWWLQVHVYNNIDITCLQSTNQRPFCVPVGARLVHCLTLIFRWLLLGTCKLVKSVSLPHFRTRLLLSPRSFDNQFYTLQRSRWSFLLLTVLSIVHRQSSVPVWTLIISHRNYITSLRRPRPPTKDCPSEFRFTSRNQITNRAPIHKPRLPYCGELLLNFSSTYWNRHAQTRSPKYHIKRRLHWNILESHNRNH